MLAYVSFFPLNLVVERCGEYGGLGMRRKNAVISEGPIVDREGPNREGGGRVVLVEGLCEGECTG